MVNDYLPRMISDLMKLWGQSEAWVYNYYQIPKEKA